MRSDLLFRHLRRVLFPPGTRRESIAKSIYRRLRSRKTTVQCTLSANQDAATPSAAFLQQVTLNPGPGSDIGNAQILPRPSSEFLTELDRIAAENQYGRKADIICFSIIDWSFRYQRPQQLMSQAALQGHRVFYLNTSQFLDPQSSPRAEATLIKPNVWEVKLAARRARRLWRGDPRSSCGHNH